MPARRRRRPDPAKVKLGRGIIRRHQGSGLSLHALCAREGSKDCNFLQGRRELSRRDREKNTAIPNSSAEERNLLWSDPTDMRKGFDSLAHRLGSSRTLDPLSGHLFVFRRRRGDRIKILSGDKEGYAMWYKRLEKGSFRFPTGPATAGVAGVKVKAADRMMIRDGVDLGSVRRPPRYERQPAGDCREGTPSRSRPRPEKLGMSEPAASRPHDRALCHEIIRQQADTIRESPRPITPLEPQVEPQRITSTSRDHLPLDRREDLVARQGGAVPGPARGKNTTRSPRPRGPPAARSGPRTSPPGSGRSWALSGPAR